MTNLEHLESAEGCLKNDGRHFLAHVVQDAREEIIALRVELGVAKQVIHENDMRELDRLGNPFAKRRRITRPN